MGQKLLLENMAESFTSTAELENIKEKLCYVAQKYDEEHAQTVNSSETDMAYKLPDKRVINVPGSVRIKAPELLFKPELNGFSCKAMHQLAWQSVQGSDKEPDSVRWHHHVSGSPRQN